MRTEKPMDKKIKTKSTFFDGIKTALKREADKRRATKLLILVDAAVFLISLFFARRHLVLGAYPLAIAWLAVLPSGVFIALPGAVLGYLSLGQSGVIFAVSAAAVVIFRLVCSLVSGEDARLFGEGGAMRIGSCALGAAIGAGYEMILGSFSASSMIFASTQILLSVGLSLLLFGVFSYDITLARIFVSGTVFAQKRVGKDRVAFLVFALSLLFFIFLLGVSLSGYNFFGISLSYLFVGALTLFTARRFGAVRAMTVGFFSAVGIDPVGAVGFALAGLVAGFLFEIGPIYGLVGGGAAISAWCAYSGGMSLFLSAIPEWSIASAVMIPYLRSAKRERIEEDVAVSPPQNDRVINERIDALKGEIDMTCMAERACASAGVVRDYFSLGRGDISEYRNAVIAATAHIDPTPCEEKIDELASLLYSKGSVTELDIQRVLDINYGVGAVLASLNFSVRTYERELYKKGGKIIADEMEIQASLIRNSQARVRESFTECDTLSEKVIQKVRMAGVCEASCRVLGARKRIVCLAAQDDGSQRINSAEVIKAIEGALGTTLCLPTLKRTGNTLLLEAREAQRLDYDVGVCSRPSRAGVASGDGSAFFEKDGILFAVISDGMGTGDVAMQTSRLVCDYLRYGIGGSDDIESLISAVNGIVVASGTECCATVDIFYLDLYTGECGFVKAGAPPSFIKKADSVRRIRAKSNPIGAMESVNCERCVAEVGVGDYVIMMSDGVSEIPEETLWLLDAVTEPCESAQNMADKIIALAERNNVSTDDMSVVAVKVSAFLKRGKERG